MKKPNSIFVDNILKVLQDPDKTDEQIKVELRNLVKEEVDSCVLAAKYPTTVSQQIH